jgi:hypothetical protein
MHLLAIFARQRIEGLDEHNHRHGKSRQKK